MSLYPRATRALSAQYSCDRVAGGVVPAGRERGQCAFVHAKITKSRGICAPTGRPGQPDGRTAVVVPAGPRGRCAGGTPAVVPASANPGSGHEGLTVARSGKVPFPVVSAGTPADSGRGAHYEVPPKRLINGSNGSSGGRPGNDS
jgi:hypothetical protein